MEEHVWKHFKTYEQEGIAEKMECLIIQDNGINSSSTNESEVSLGVNILLEDKVLWPYAR